MFGAPVPEPERTLPQTEEDDRRVFHRARPDFPSRPAHGRDGECGALSTPALADYR